MGMGTNTTTEGGFSGVSDGAGYTGVGTTTTTPEDFDFMGMMKALASDPESAKMITDALGKFASTLTSAKKIPPHAQQFIKRSMDDRARRQMQVQSNDPYMGDVTRFFTPEMAAGALAEMGIPTRRMRI